jgi:hypothetical protein
MLHEILDIFTYSSVFFITLFIIGFIKSPPAVFLTFSFLIKIMIAIFLLYKFGYKKNNTFSELDRRIIILISMFMLIISFTDIINQFINEIRTLINPNYKPTDKVKWF